MSSSQLRLLSFIGVLVLLAVAAFTLPIGEWMTAVLAWVQAHREVSWAVFALLYIAAAVLLLPGSILTFAGGFLFGLVGGVALVSLSSVLGATAAFLLGRFLAREWIAGKAAQWRRFGALDRAIASRGFLVVLLVRLSPVFPFNLLNYALGLTAVPLRHYVLASWLGMFPATVLYVWAGTLAQNLTAAATSAAGTGWAGHALLVLGLAATLAVTVIVTRLANRELRRQLQDADPTATTPVTGS